MGENMNKWVNECLSWRVRACESEWMNAWMTEWIDGCVIGCRWMGLNDVVSKWMHKQMNEWLRGRVKLPHIWWKMTKCPRLTGDDVRDPPSAKFRFLNAFASFRYNSASNNSPACPSNDIEELSSAGGPIVYQRLRRSAPQTFNKHYLILCGLLLLTSQSFWCRMIYIYIFLHRLHWHEWH